MQQRKKEQKVVDVSWEEFDRVADKLANEIIEKENKRGREFIGVYPIPRGGFCLGVALSHRLGIQLTHILFQQDIIIVDEIADDGKTLNYHMKHNPHKEDCLTVVWHMRKGSLYKPDIVGEKLTTSAWVRYPWERWYKGGVI